MKRLTKKELLAGHNISYVGVEDCFDVWSVPKKFMGNAIDRLAFKEDILGDEYDLDRLRELVRADGDGRCVVLPSDIAITDGEKALRRAMAVLSVSNNGPNRYIADAVAEKLTRETAEAALKAREHNG